MTSGVWRAAARDIGREKCEPLAPPARRACRQGVFFRPPAGGGGGPTPSAVGPGAASTRFERPEGLRMIPGSAPARLDPAFDDTTACVGRLEINAPRTRQATISGDRPITRSGASACAIAAARLAAAGAPRSLRAYIAHASAHFCCRGERPFPARRHASGSVSCRAPPAPGRARPSASWRRNVGSTAWRRCWVEDRPSSFFLRRAFSWSMPPFAKDRHRRSPGIAERRWCIRLCFRRARGLAHIADDRLPAFVHRHVLQRDLLLADAAVALNSPVKMSRFDQATSRVTATIRAAVSTSDAAMITKAIVSAA